MGAKYTPSPASYAYGRVQTYKIDTKFAILNVQIVAHCTPSKVHGFTYYKGAAMDAMLVWQFEEKNCVIFIVRFFFLHLESEGNCGIDHFGADFKAIIIPNQISELIQQPHILEWK